MSCNRGYGWLSCEGFTLGCILAIPTYCVGELRADDEGRPAWQGRGSQQQTLHPCRSAYPELCWGEMQGYSNFPGQTGADLVQMKPGRGHMPRGPEVGLVNAGPQMVPTGDLNPIGGMVPSHQGLGAHIFDY